MPKGVIPRSMRPAVLDFSDYNDATPLTMAKRRCTLKQRHLVELHVSDPHAPYADIGEIAGYRANTPQDIAKIVSREFKKTDVARYMELLYEDRYRNLGVTADMVMSEMAAIAFFNVYDVIELRADGVPYLNLHKMKREHWSAVKKIKTRALKVGRDEDAVPLEEIEIEFYDKQKALLEIGRQLGMFNPATKHELHLGGMQNPTEINIMPIARGAGIDDPDLAGIPDAPTIDGHLIDGNHVIALPSAQIDR